MDMEKTQKELLRKRIEEDRKERKERSEQQRLRREALAVDGAVPAAKRVQIVGGEIRVVEGGKKGEVAVGKTVGEDDEDYQEGMRMGMTMMTTMRWGNRGMHCYQCVHLKLVRQDRLPYCIILPS